MPSLPRVAGMLTLVLAEAALELLPPELRGIKSIIAQAYSRGRRPEETLLDRSFHHRAMAGIRDSAKRGRPDLAHFSLLEATSTPLYAKGLLGVYVHTYPNQIIKLGHLIRLPKTYSRFEGLMMRLFREKVIKAEDKTLLDLSEMSFSGLVSGFRPSVVVGLSRIGRKSSFHEVASRLAAEDRPIVVVGGFPRGHFSHEVRGVLDEVYSVCEMSLEAHVVVARVLYEYERLMKVKC